MTAARVASVRFMTILSKSAFKKLCFLLLQFAEPVIKFVVVAPLGGGNEFGTRPQNKILVPFRCVVEIFRRAPRPFYSRVPPLRVEAYRLIKILESLSSSVFERKTSTGNELFASLGSA